MHMLKRFSPPTKMELPNGKCAFFFRLLRPPAVQGNKCVYERQCVTGFVDKVGGGG